MGDRDSDLTPGWLSETVTTIGTGGLAAPESPSQSELEGQPASLQLTGELPTAQMLGGDESVEEARSLLDPGAGGDDSFSFDFEFGFGSESESGEDEERWLDW